MRPSTRERSSRLLLLFCTWKVHEGSTDVIRNSLSYDNPPGTAYRRIPQRRRSRSLSRLYWKEKRENSTTGLHRLFLSRTVRIPARYANHSAVEVPRAHLRRP